MTPSLHDSITPWFLPTCRDEDEDDDDDEEGNKDDEHEHDGEDDWGAKRPRSPLATGN